MAKQIIAVVGGTGMQGGGVVDALLARGTFTVRVPTRNPDSDAGQALAARGVEVVKADMLDPTSLEKAVAGAHGAFLVTSFWDPTTGAREAEVGTAAVKAIKAAGVKHLVWSTLADVEKHTQGRLHVVHFTGKAKVDDAVRSAGFERFSFVEAPMYFQNFLTMMGPQPLPNGGKGWAVPMDPAKRCIHAGDVTEVGRAVAAALESSPETLPNGSYVGVCGGVYSWTDFVETLNAQGHSVQVIEVPPQVYDGFFPGAEEMREMFQWFAEQTYFGPDHAKLIENARTLVPEGFTGFAEWAKKNMKPS
ncbi:MAG: NmrA/HSCARG family protein [Myxococcales bacterium]|nr:NmrA/HSCARG family protein [Myxococcales bacterium]